MSTPSGSAAHRVPDPLAELEEELGPARAAVTHAEVDDDQVGIARQIHGLPLYTGGHGASLSQLAPEHIAAGRQNRRRRRRSGSRTRARARRRRRPGRSGRRRQSRSLVRPDRPGRRRRRALARVRLPDRLRRRRDRGGDLRLCARAQAGLDSRHGRPGQARDRGSVGLSRPDRHLPRHAGPQRARGGDLPQVRQVDPGLGPPPSPTGCCCTRTTSFSPIHGGMRQYWRDYESLETGTRHAAPPGLVARLPARLGRDRLPGTRCTRCVEAWRPSTTTCRTRWASSVSLPASPPAAGCSGRAGG